MLGKLIKYEFKATGRVFLPLFGALLVVAIVSRIFMSLSFEIPSVIGVAVSVIMIISIFVITLIITLQRFYKNLLSNEGYLMFTLPVKTDHLIWSKLLVASVWMVVSGVIVILAIAIMALTGISFQEIRDAIAHLRDLINIEALRLAVYIIEALVVLIASLLASVLTLYACMSLSLFFNKYRALSAFGAYIIINIIGQILGSILVVVGDAMNIQDFFMGLTINQQIHTAAAAVILTQLVTGVIFYLVTKYMLKYKLNLE